MNIQGKPAEGPTAVGSRNGEARSADSDPGPGTSPTPQSDAHRPAPSPVPGRSVASSVAMTIEQLTLDGFDGVDRFEVGRSMERELARLISDNGFPASFSDRSTIDRLDVGELRIEEGAGAGRIGREIARAIYRGMRR